MELKAGYKQTEVGIIPEDWELKEFKEISFMKGRIGWQGLKQTEFTMNSEEPFLITGMNFKDGDIRWDEVYHVSEERYQVAKEIQLKIDDILMTKDGTIGKLLYVKNIPYPHHATLNSHLLVFRPINHSYVPLYLYYNLHSPFFERHIDLNKSGTTFFGISQTSVSKYKIPLPPTKTEQTAIATALSDTDALINALDKLIAKKRLIKQGAMQQLLSGKKRLAGFSGEWEIKLFKDISFMKGRIGWQGLNQTEFTMNSDQPYLITGMNFKDGEICWDDVYHVSWERYEIAKEIQLKLNDILMTKDGTIGKLLFVNQIPEPQAATLNSHLLVFRPVKNSYIPKFIYYQLHSESFLNHIEITKSGTTFFGISQESVGEYKISLPPIEEQTAIAQILSDMDNEIEVLEKRRAKTQQIKHGMMQELLTGKTRLINPIHLGEQP